MPGKLRYFGKHPEVGSEVLIVVDSKNKPSGVWLGELTEDIVALAYDLPNGEKTCECIAVIGGKWPNPGLPPKQPPYTDPIDYTAYEPRAAMHELLRMRREDKLEIKNLNKRLDIERGVFHGALKAMVSDKGFDKLEALLEGFLERLDDKLAR